MLLQIQETAKELAQAAASKSDTALLQVIAVLLTIIVLLNILYMSQNNSIKKELKDFVKEVRCVISRFDTVEAEHDLLTGKGRHGHKAITDEK